MLNVNFSTQVGKQRGSVDIRSVAGTGPFGRITASDVEAAAGIAPSVAAPPPPPPPAAAAKATTTSSSSPPLLPGSSVVPFTAMQSDVSKNMIESLFVPMFRVGYPVNTDALDAPYEKVKPKGVLLSTINWAICKAIDLLELLKIEEEMLSAQSRKTVKRSTSWCNDNSLRREEEDKEDNAEDEEAVMKARAVDDWKNYNPCGACNQKLTTCD
uniref:Peripheral subunit-binding (PSBD) domain-containing protein n=1 Tax=Brassica campestris TaxID=3711 RepID=M4CPG0_BRACM